MFDVLMIGSYGVLVVLWSIILGLYLNYMRHRRRLGLTLSILVTVLAIDAFRTLFESSYFGLQRGAFIGIFPEDLGLLLSQPQYIIAPKLLNVVVALLVLVLLLRYWLPREIEYRAAVEQRLETSEGRLRDFSEVSYDWLWETGPDLCFTLISKNPQSGAPSNMDWLIGQSCVDVVVSGNESDEKWKTHMAQIENRMPFQHCAYQMQLPNGDVRDMVSSGKPYLSADGSFGGYRGATRDITDLKQAEAAVWATEMAHWNRESHFKAIVDSAADGILLLDTHGRIVDANDGASEIFGYDKQVLCGMVVSDLDEWLDTIRVRALIDELHERPWLTFDGMGKRNDGSTFPTEIKISRLREKKREGVVVVVRDISWRQHRHDT